MRIKAIIIGLLAILLIGASYPSIMYKIMHQYKEECYEYGVYEKEYCTGYWSSTNYNLTDEGWEELNSTIPICRCGDIMYFDGCLKTRTLTNESNCLKYHLVRNSDIQ